MPRDEAERPRVGERLTDRPLTLASDPAAPGLEYAPPVAQPDIWYAYRDNTPTGDAVRPTPQQGLQVYWPRSENAGTYVPFNSLRHHSPVDLRSTAVVKR